MNILIGSRKKRDVQFLRGSLPASGWNGRNYIVNYFVSNAPSDIDVSGTVAAALSTWGAVSNVCFKEKVNTREKLQFRVNFKSCKKPQTGIEFCW
mgnify:CR=1 FL=1